MSDKTLKVKPWGKDQGDYVIIDAASFDESLHTRLDAKSDNEERKDLISREALDEALGRLPGEYTDPDYVISGMRTHFGDLFTNDDEVRVRDLVKAPVKKPSHGLRIDDIKGKLAEKNIEFNADADRAELAKLLDEAE